MSAEQTPDIERVLAETLTLAVMHYYGFTDEDIAAAEQVHPGRVCDEDECFDEDGTSVHGRAWVELGATANTVVEAVLPALAPVLAAADERAYLRGYEAGLLAPQSEWMKARDRDLREAEQRALREAADSVMRHGSDGGPVRLVTVRRWLLDRADVRADRVAEPQRMNPKRDWVTPGSPLERDLAIADAEQTEPQHEAATSGKESEASDE